MAMGKGLPVTIDEWFSFIGKGNLQDFQDCFSSETGISLALVGKAGEELLVKSKARWFCDFSRSQFAHSCDFDDSKMLSGHIKQYEARHTYDPTEFICGFGMMGFILPIYFDNCLTAFWQGGGYTIEGQYCAETLKTKFDVVVLTRNELDQCLRRLVAMTRLMNISLSGIYAQEPDNRLRKEMLLSKKLTKREQEVAELVCRGMSNKEVAAFMFLSEKTVKNHMGSILAKLGVRDRSQLMFEYGNRHEEDVSI